MDMRTLDEEAAEQVAAADTIEQRLATLESQVRVLKSENIAIRAKLVELAERGGRRVTPVAPIEPQTRVHTPIVTAPMDLPSDQELRALREICRVSGYQIWADGAGFASDLFRAGDPARQWAGDEAWLGQLSRAIAVISQMRKIQKPDPNARLHFGLIAAAPLPARSVVLARSGWHHCSWG